MENTVQIKYAGNINVISGNNPRALYEHQEEAIKKLDIIDKNDTFKSLLVLPTGGGKTLTSVYWLLRNAVNKNKKILWVAHRHLLLEQAADTFQKNAYSNLLYNISGFTYRIISGKHDKPINIKGTDNVLLISKDSLVRNITMLDNWLKTEDELYLVIDEAHHATAKSYRRLIDYVINKVPNTKLLGLTATPFRTADNEQGLLAKIFTNEIVYKVDLIDLIKKSILSRPVFEECETEIEFGESLGLNALRSIEQLDNLPDDIANAIACNKIRNSKIVKQYAENQDTYGQTLVFAINRMHAFVLKGLFQKYDIPAEVIVSGTQAEFIGIDISNIENEQHIEDYRSGKVRVLINVNILTEGIDLPKTKTVFLTRPTVSSILMTQMIGRALRGERAGGTKEAYIVSFIDEWKEKIAWVNAENLINCEEEFADKYAAYQKRLTRMLSIAKIEEFARIMDETVDTAKLESIDFMKRVPLGMYMFTFIDDDKMERNYQVLVYDSTKKQYEDFIKDLPLLFKQYNIEDEMIPDDILDNIIKIISNTYFDEFMIPTYDDKDIKNILKYFAQKECEPKFISFNDLDRKKLDVGAIAKEIVNKDMRRSEMREYIENIWNKEDSLLKIYFNKKMYFLRQLQTEIDKLEGEFEYYNEEENIEYENRALNTLSLYDLSKVKPERAREIKDKVYEKYNDKGKYYCKECGFKSSLKVLFQIDHIKPMSKGGLTEVVNLQLLCKTCNMKKSDKYE